MESRMAITRRITSGLSGILPLVEGVVEEELVVEELVFGTVMTSGIIMSEVFTVICDRPKTRARVSR